MKLQKSNTKIACMNCGVEYPYSESCPCGKGGGGVKYHGPDCTTCEFGAINPFGNGDVLCSLKIEGSTGIGYYCDKWEGLKL